MRIRPLRAVLARSDQAGVFAAAASASGTFQRTLMPRNDIDQGMVTGLTMSLNYMIASLMYDAVESVAGYALLGPGGKTGDPADEDQLRRVTLAMGAAGLVAGMAVQMGFEQTEGESARRAAGRTAGFWLSMASMSGFSAGALEEALSAIDRRSSRDLHLRNMPAALVAGTAFSMVREVQRRRRESSFGITEGHTGAISGAKSIAMGAGVTAALTLLSASNRAMTRLVGHGLGRVLPGDDRLWRPVGHAISLGALGALLYVQLARVNQKIESGAGVVEEAFDDPPKSPLVSGSAESHVSWETLSREGRRHVSTFVRKQWIENVMHEPAIDPIRVYVGLDSAPTEEERVQLAIAELERTGAFERKLIIAVSPTGTGYVNYTAIGCAECYTRGDCATVTLQYSKRPSPMSLDRVWEGRKHFRMLLAAIRRKLYDMAPEDRPRLVVFGESLGAHTSQDAFLNTGTQGVRDAGVERALWIGTPHLSGWNKQVQNASRLDVDIDTVGDFNSFDEVEALSLEKRKKLRYYKITHGNDGVGVFDPMLLIQKPKWLGDPEARPPGVPKSERYVTPLTLVQTLFDMKNAMGAGPDEFVADGHDYRADLPRFVLEAFGLECSEEQFERVEEGIRRYDAGVNKWLGGEIPQEVLQADGIVRSNGSNGGSPAMTDAKADPS